ncbi:hypothetical protein [Pseudomonas sp.]|uniref:hypothetical protein n=1 Tax=Pseudomonas sp. TaxID=306 RepID=UPI0029091E86|nr:hypothetical protein [Pseudomonas sp.]MDU4254015.1 hypothetical protein [Pseudomonas sp.]
MAWTSISHPPVAINHDDFTLRSEPVQGLYKDGTQAVVRWYPPSEDCEGSWKTTCASAWDVTGYITHWRELFSPRLECTTAYVVEDEQLDTLKTIVKGLYGDGQNVSPDRRRDLANQLHQLVGTIQSQCIELEAYLCGVSAHL